MKITSSNLQRTADVFSKRNSLDDTKLGLTILDSIAVKEPSELSYKLPDR